MKSEAPSATEFGVLLSGAINELRSQRQREFIESKLVQPYEARLHWEYGAEEQFVTWVFADMGERNVVAQYCLGGHGALGRPWGINFRNNEHFGQDTGWYKGLGQLIADWGIEP